MHLFLTGVLPFLAHDHASAAAFLTCRHHNFHASIIPEFLSDEDRVKAFCQARQKDQLRVDEVTLYKNLYNLFVQTPLMQFSPSLVLRQWGCVDTILKPLLATKYFTRTLQRCSVGDNIPLTNDLLQGLSRVRSLTKFFLCEVKTEQLEIIINSFLSLESLTIENAYWLNLSSQPATTTKAPLRSLTLPRVDSSFATQFVPNFPNLRKLELGGQQAYQKLDLLPFSSSLPLLKDMSLRGFSLRNEQKTLTNLVHLSSLRFERCQLSDDDLSFLTTQDDNENTVVVLPELTTFRIDSCGELSTDSFESLANTPNLHDLEIVSESFDNDCLQYLENMTHLRKLDLLYTRIVGDSSRSLQTLMQNLIQLEELNLCGCYGIGNHQGAIAEALYSNKHTRLCVLNLSSCSLVDDDLKGIDSLKNTLQELDLTGNTNLTNEGLRQCKELVKLKKLSVPHCHGVDDLSPLKDCLSLEDLNVSFCRQMTNDSFKVFSEEPDSFRNLRVLNLSNFERFTEKVFDHLSNNNNLVYQLKELGAGGLSEIFSSSATARNNMYKLKGLRQLKGIVYLMSSESDRNRLAGEVMRNLINLEEIC